MRRRVCPALFLVGMLFLSLLVIAVSSVFLPPSSPVAIFPVTKSHPPLLTTPTRLRPYPYPILTRLPGPTWTPSRPSKPTSTPLPSTPTWPIIVPSLVASPTFTKPAVAYFAHYTPQPTRTVPPAWSEALAAALVPPPVLYPHSEVQGPAVWQTLESAPLDVDGDGRDETLWFYLLSPVYEQQDYFHYIYGYWGLALLDDDDNLLWCSEPRNVQEFMGDIGVLAITAEPITLSPGVLGVLSRRYEECLCNGAYRREVTTLYYWDGSELQAIWERTTAGGGHLGASHGSSEWEIVEVRDIDGGGWPEVLLKWGAFVYDSDHPRRDYTFYSPGIVAFRWDGEAYVPGYFVDNGRITPIRSCLPLYYAPRFSVPPTIDGQDEEWWQVEYREELLLRPPKGDFIDLDAAWDEQYLYLYVPPLGQETLFVAVDTDLTGDWGDSTLSSDDFVWRIDVSAQPPCTVTLDLCAPDDIEDWTGECRIAAAARRQGCSVELALPLARLGLAGADLVPEKGWVIGSSEPLGREYHPCAGQIIGFMVGPGEGTDRPDNPTTWTTLVFIADR